MRRTKGQGSIEEEEEEEESLTVRENSCGGCFRDTTAETSLPLWNTNMGVGFEV